MQDFIWSGFLPTFFNYNPVISNNIFHSLCAENERWVMLVCIYDLVSSAKFMLCVSFPWFSQCFSSQIVKHFWHWNFHRLFCSCEVNENKCLDKKRDIFTLWKYPERQVGNWSLWNTWKSTQEIDARSASITDKFQLKLACF